MKNINSDKKLREFGLFVGIALPLIFGWILPAISAHDFRVWTLFIGIPCLILSFLKPGLLSLPYNFWMKIGFILGWVNSRIILGIIFIFVLLPISIIMKFFKYDPLQQKLLKNKTYKENTEENLIDLKRIF